MRPVIIGTEGSLRDAVVNGIAGELGVPIIRADKAAVADRYGISAPIHANDPHKVAEYLETLTELHSSMVDGHRGRSMIITDSVFESLAYFMATCWDAVDGATSRIVYRNCIDYARSKYTGQIFLMVLTGINYFHNEGTLFADGMMREYMYEMIITGLLNRWDIKYTPIIVENMEEGISELLLRIRT